MSSTEIVAATGRPMTKALEAALDGVRRRRIVAQVSTEWAAKGGPLSGLYRAIALELYLAEMREQDVLRGLSLDSLEPLDSPGHPIPPADGPALLFDPESGQTRPLNGDGPVT